MKLFTTLSAVTLICLATNSVVSGRDREFEIDVLQPYQKFLEAKASAEAFPICWPAIGELLAKALEFLGSCLNGEAEIFEAQRVLSIPFQNPVCPTPETSNQNANPFETCADKIDFVQIDQFIWNSCQFHDLIGFMHDRGFKNEHSIYDKIKEIYASNGWDDTNVPSAPPTDWTQYCSIESSSRTKRSLNDPSTSIFQADPMPCVEIILEILIKLTETNLLPWLSFSRNVTTMINTDPSVHFLIAKAAETPKGYEFRKFRQEIMGDYVRCLDQNLKDNDIFKLIIDIIECWTGIDFEGSGINVIENLISIAEYLMWRMPFPH